MPMMSTMPRLGAAIMAATLATALPAHAQPLLADLFKHRITIDPGFTGAVDLVFGSIDGGKGDLIVVVRGPNERVVVRRKDRVAGVWINRDKMEFDGVPAYYAVAANRPLEEIASPNYLKLHQIGLDALRIKPLTSRPADEIAAFREALIRNRVREGLYADGVGKVARPPGGRLFRTVLHFPANVAEGTYSAQVFLIRDGDEVGAETIPLFINKTGVLAEIKYRARTQPALYGLGAIIVALAAGWVAALAFRKP